jgi:hypothetical protein
MRANAVASLGFRRGAVRRTPSPHNGARVTSWRSGCDRRGKPQHITIRIGHPDLAKLEMGGVAPIDALLERDERLDTPGAQTHFESGDIGTGNLEIEAAPERPLQWGSANPPARTGGLFKHEFSAVKGEESESLLWTLIDDAKPERSKIEIKRLVEIGDIEFRNQRVHLSGSAILRALRRVAGPMVPPPRLERGTSRSTI